MLYEQASKESNRKKTFEWGFNLRVASVIAIARQVVPMPPLGMFKGLEHPYASAEAIKKMDTLWDQLAEERNHWAKGIEQHIF
jgi:hypothetical protein